MIWSFIGLTTTFCEFLMRCGVQYDMFFGALIPRNSSIFTTLLIKGSWETHVSDVSNG